MGELERRRKEKMGEKLEIINYELSFQPVVGFGVAGTFSAPGYRTPSDILYLFLLYLMLRAS